jgi:hypothetical protein
MAAPSYTTDLTLVDAADAITNWAESSDGNWDDGGPPTQETDYFIHNGGTAACISAEARTVKGNHGTLIVDNGSGITVPTDGAILIWAYFAAPNALDSYANGGLKLVAGDTLGDFYYWIIGGNDFSRNPYGGWENFAVDPDESSDGSAGSPTGTIQYMGIAHLITAAISKGNPFGVDVVRYGRCEARFADGDVGNGYCTFSGFAAQNDAVGNRWGLIQAIPGGYLWKGLMTIGYGGVADFRDQNIGIVIDDTRKVSANFNRIEVVTSGTKLYLDNCSIESLGTVARGRFEMMDNADVQLDACQFTNMDTFGFMSNSQATDCTFRGCNEVVASGTDLTGTSVLVPTVGNDESAVVWDYNLDTDGYLDDMIFSKGSASHHALEIGTNAPDAITLRGWTTTGFSASNEQDDSTFYVAKPTDTMTINVVGGTGNFTYKSAGATVSIVIDPVTTKVTIRDPGGDEVEGARVFLEASSAAGDLPYLASIGIVRSGSTATVTHSGHNLSSGDKVAIRKADQQPYNGIKTISNVTSSGYDYTVAGTPDTPATGSITSTGVVLHDTTSAAGVAQASRTFTTGQPVKGYGRLASEPRYKDIVLSDTVDNVDGLTLDRRFILDE